MVVDAVVVEVVAEAEAVVGHYECQQAFSILLFLLSFLSSYDVVLDDMLTNIFLRCIPS